MARVAGIVLAAGYSRRLGEPKQFVRLCGKPALQLVLDTARRSRLDPLVLVLGPHLTSGVGSLDTSGFSLVLNERAHEGQSTSVQAGLRPLPADVDGVVFLLGDQPFVEPVVIDRLIECFEQSHAAIVRPRYADGPGNPVLIARRLFRELERLRGDSGARPLLAKYTAELVDCDVTEFESPLDLDTVEDVERARERCRQRGNER